MKKISDITIKKIMACLAKGDTSLTGFPLEKDFLIFDAMKIINSLPQNQYLTPVFCGGTCLSKAYNV